jgi:puromycin-sensitive aminopeptidase
VSGVSERLPHRLPRDVVPEHYTLVFEPDLDQASFTGEATLELRARKVTTEVVLNAAELDITEARFEWDGTDSVIAKVSYIPDEEQAVLTLPAPVGPGHLRAHLRFSGKLNQLLRGFYRSSWRLPDRTDGWIATTHFESTDARRAFPCWDEPDLKATFGITIVADDGLAVLSNSRELSSELLGNGKRRTTFADTIKMSTYLVAMVVGPFELTAPKLVDNVPVRVGSVPGRGGLRSLAEDAAAHALSFLRNYFAMPYPADKLDHVAVPDFAAGAMENLGLVIYRESALLVDPEQSSQAERQRVVSVIAHETAHMWFGDLVTMRWWDGIWLNEAFATFMELLATDAFKPDWQVWTSFGTDRARALATDSLQSGRAIEHPVGRPEEADDMFDEITYDKGASVLRMIERYLGEDSFRRGVNLYLDRHRHSNTETTDLWDTLEIASGEPVRATMGTWVSQAGHPLVTAELAADRTSLYLSQRHFLLHGEPDDRQWVVPVTFRYATADGEVHRGQVLLDSTSTLVNLVSDPAWLVLNEGAWGVYRAHYSEELRRRLLGALEQLDARERLGLVVDTWAETIAGLVSLSDSLRLWSLLEDERDPDVWSGLAGSLALLELVVTDGELPLLRRLVRQLAGKVFADIGWGDGAVVPDEGPRLARLRARLVTLLGTAGADPEVRAQARQRLQDADAGRSPLPPDLATAVAQVVAAAGSDDEWDLLYSHYKGANNPQDEMRYLHALAGFTQPHLVDRTLALALSDEVRTQDAPFLVAGVLARREGSALAWRAIESNWETMLSRWPPHSLHRALESIPALVSADGEVIARAVAWLNAHPLARGERKVAQARERLEVNLGFRNRVAGQLATALGRSG